ncbi:hypothetical protein NDU88_004526 [Pleurodeles waltl]|uniref:Uncharacterized protein n=1 Tax=Pleurodeles waltl TaxID=8319 RepID=A0AAV7TRL8_PLEWA|nr:hypothetical protein NDU88_004526 [Pleurodeles waltl]
MSTFDRRPMGGRVSTHFDYHDSLVRRGCSLGVTIGSFKYHWPCAGAIPGSACSVSQAGHPNAQVCCAVRSRGGPTLGTCPLQSIYGKATLRSVSLRLGSQKRPPEPARVLRRTPVQQHGLSFTTLPSLEPLPSAGSTALTTVGARSRRSPQGPLNNAGTQPAVLPSGHLLRFYPGLLALSSPQAAAPESRIGRHLYSSAASRCPVKGSSTCRPPILRIRP